MSSVPSSASETTMRTPPLFIAARVMIARCLRLSWRNLEVMTTSILLPIILLVLFVYLFGGAIATGAQHYITYVVPGVLLLSVAFSATVTAVSVSQDMTTGIVDRFRSLDVSGAALLAGHVAAAVVRNVVSTVLVLGVALLIGFRPSAGPLAWLEAAVILVFFILAFSWVAAVIGVFAKSPEAASSFAFFLVFLPYASSALVPVQTMPSWLQGFARNQPITPVTETIRGLLLGMPIGANPVHAVAWCGGILLVAVLLAGVLFQRRSA